MWRAIRANKEDRVAKLEWASNGGLGRAIIGKARFIFVLTLLSAGPIGLTFIPQWTEHLAYEGPCPQRRTDPSVFLTHLVQSPFDVRVTHASSSASFTCLRTVESSTARTDFNTDGCPVRIIRTPW